MNVWMHLRANKILIYFVCKLIKDICQNTFLEGIYSTFQPFISAQEVAVQGEHVSRTKDIKKAQMRFKKLGKLDSDWKLLEQWHKGIDRERDQYCNNLTYRGNPQGIVTNILEYNIVVSNFELFS